MDLEESGDAHMEEELKVSSSKDSGPLVTSDLNVSTMSSSLKHKQSHYDPD